MLNRRSFLQASASAALAATGAPAKRQNFLVVLADDLGFSDLGCYGGDIDTPNIDRLAAGGVRFSQMYSTARCGPSRNCIQTGYYAQQNACDVMTPGNIPVWTKFAPEYLKPLGYRAYHSGKWHIRFKPCAAAGYDHSYHLQDQDRFFSPKRQLLDDELLPQVKLGDGFYGTIAIADYAVKFLKEHARDHASKPFYFYLPFTAPHFPLHALPEDIDRYKDKFAEGWDAVRERRHSRLRRQGLINTALAPLEAEMRPTWNTTDQELIEKIGPGEVTKALPWHTLTPEQKKFQRLKMAIHAAMITRMDRELGRVLDQIKAMNAFEDTVILFLSDNGASSEQLIRNDGHDPNVPAGSAMSHLGIGPGWASCSNAPFRLHKSWVHEGGVSSAFIAHWPNGIEDAGAIRHTPGQLVDVVPTLLDLAGSNTRTADEGAPQMPGRSLAPAFRKNVAVQRESIYFNHSNNRALRMGDWKIVAAGKDSPWEMYDMRGDRSEQNNVIGQNSTKAAQMAALWSKMDVEFVKTREAAAPTSKPRL